MRRAARNFRDHEAVVAEGRRLSFAEAWERGIRLANALLARGLTPGDRVGRSSPFQLGARVGAGRFGTLIPTKKAEEGRS